MREQYASAKICKRKPESFGVIKGEQTFTLRDKPDPNDCVGGSQVLHRACQTVEILLFTL
jgi:hypothetical protein